MMIISSPFWHLMQGLCRKIYVDYSIEHEKTDEVTQIPYKYAVGKRSFALLPGSNTVAVRGFTTLVMRWSLSVLQSPWWVTKPTQIPFAIPLISTSGESQRALGFKGWMCTMHLMQKSQLKKMGSQEKKQDSYSRAIRRLKSDICKLYIQPSHNRFHIPTIQLRIMIIDLWRTRSVWYLCELSRLSIKTPASAIHQVTELCSIVFRVVPSNLIRWSKFGTSLSQKQATEYNVPHSFWYPGNPESHDKPSVSPTHLPCEHHGFINHESV